MAEYPSAPHDRLSDLAGSIARWPWPVAESALSGLADSQGWTLLDEDPGSGSTYDTGLVGSRAWASVTVLDGMVAEVNITTSVLVEPDSADGQAHLQDVFADQVETVSSVLGAPARNNPGSSPTADWELADGAALHVGKAKRSCFWTLVSPKYAEIQRDLGR